MGLSREYIGMMEEKMETTGGIGIISGLYRDYRVCILGLYGDNGKENGSYDLGFDLGFWVWGRKFRVWILGFRVQRFTGRSKAIILELKLCT